MPGILAWLDHGFGWDSQKPTNFNAGCEDVTSNQEEAATLPSANDGLLGGMENHFKSAEACAFFRVFYAFSPCTAGFPGNKQGLA